MNKTDKRIAQSEGRIAKQWEGPIVGKLYKALLAESLTMPPELLKAHRDNDRAVMATYGFLATLTESEIVAHLLTLYSKLIQRH